MEKLLLTGLHHIYRPECCFEPATQSVIMCICNLNINVNNVPYVLGKSQVHMLQLMCNTIYALSKFSYHSNNISVNPTINCHNSSQGYKYIL